jgi:hypothetical protein
MKHTGTTNRGLLLAICLAVRPAGSLPAAEGVILDPTEIVRRSDDLLRRGQSYAQFEMVIRRPEWTRTLVMDGWTQGTSNSLMKALAPKKEEGVTFLKKGREAWQFIPSIDRVIKIPPSMMLQSWMGSDFTNDDVVRADSLVVDYTHAITDETSENGVRYWLIEGIPKPNAPVVWGKIVFKIRQANQVADRVDFYDEDGTLIKYYQTDDIQTIEGLDVATRFTMYDLTRPGHQTSLTYRNITFQPKLRPGLFSVRSLKR